jgi:hypothetical protein
VQNAVVDTDSDPLPGEVVADRMLTSGQGE